MKTTYTTSLNGQTITAESSAKPKPFAVIWHGKKGGNETPQVSSRHARMDLAQKEIEYQMAGLGDDLGRKAILTVGTLNQ
jgi:hypothetical protein